MGHAPLGDGETAHYDSALWSRPNSELEDLGSILLGDGDDAGPDETFLETAKLKARGAWENAFLDYDEAAHLDSASLGQAKPDREALQEDLSR